MAKKEVPSFKENFVLSATPKESTSPPSPTDNPYTIANNERLFSLHLANDRVLEESVPSPGGGAGHN
ncbi:hypothetical protein QQP08_021592 [Theobroma cacao]|nr:hypothetical protein QQP08_021592 [Theobroma cacao]